MLVQYLPTLTYTRDDAADCGSVAVTQAATDVSQAPLPSTHIVQSRVLQKSVDGFLPSRTMSCTAHAGYDVTASQARLHVDGEAAIPLRSSQPCVDWGVCLRGSLLRQYPQQQRQWHQRCRVSI